MNTSNLDIPDSGGFARSPVRVVADPAWRRRERRSGTWAFWLGGLAAVSLLGAVAMLLLGTEPRAPAEAPLITADPTPVRVRPDDPGGMRVANLDKDVYNQLAPGRTQPPGQRPAAPRVESLLPPPEVPKPLPVEHASLTPGPSPQQLAREPERPATPPRAEPAVIAAPAPQATAAPPQALTPAPQAPAAPPQATAAAPQAPAAPLQPAQSAPAQRPPSAPPAQTAQPQPAAATAGAGRIQVQLAAVPSEQAAASEWERLRRRMPDLLANQRLIVSRGEREGQPFFRVRTGGFEDGAAARAFCDQVRQRGGSCFVAPAG